MTDTMSFELPRYTDSRYAVQRRVGFGWLKFAPDLEREYLEAHPLLEPARLRVASFLALGMLFTYIVIDWVFGARLTPPNAALILTAVTAPALAAPIVATTFLGTGVALQRVVFCASLVLGLSVTVVAQIGRAAMPWFPYEAVILVVMYVYMVTGLLYYQAATVGLSMWALFVMIEAIWSPGQPGRFVYESYMLFIANVVGLLGLYALHYEARKAFLMQNELLQEAMLDSLTGLLNRRELRRQLDKAWMQARRDKTSLGLLMLDVDHFKDINDRLGHLAGDKVLRCVADMLHAAAMRPLDAVGRYGGDEFLGVWYDVDPKWFEEMVNRFPGQLAKICDTPDSDRHPVTVSGGAVVAYPDQVLAPQDAISQADRKLYEAKGTGGSIVCAVLEPFSKEP